MRSSGKFGGAARTALPRGAARSEAISSAENQWLKRFRAALRSSVPEPDGWLGLEGPHLVEEAIASGLELEAILLSASGEHHMVRTQLASSASPGATSLKNVRILRTSDKLFAGVAGTETPQGIAVLVRAPNRAFEQLLAGDVPLVVVLVGVQDPGNVGTVVRSAEAFGATGVLATRGTAHPWSPKALRASAGSALRLPVMSGIAAPAALAQLRVMGLSLLAASVEPVAAASVSPAASDLRGPCAILIGNEGAGLPEEIARSADARLQIPLASSVESLNAAVAASVLLYEAARQRGNRA